MGSRLDWLVMPDITKDTVDHLSRLARIDLDEDEKEAFVEQIANILGLFSQISEIDTEGIKPTTHAMPIYNVFRPDESRDSLPQEMALRGAPDKERGYFKAPRIIEKD